MPPTVFAQRRRVVQERLDGSVLILFSASPSLRNNDVEYPFRQDSDFYYLTGFDEPDAALVLTSTACVLFLRPRDKQRETWDGRRLGVEGATATLGADAAYAIDELTSKLPQLLVGHERLLYPMAVNERIDRRVLNAVQRARQLTRRGGVSPLALEDSRKIVHEMRRLKSPEEVELMRESSRIAVEAHQLAMSLARPGMYEYEIQAAVEQVFQKRGAPRPAYNSIVGTGVNATTLHYVVNDQQLTDGDLLLLDAGCEFHYYASDITRTFPVNGVFSAAQRELYSIVVTAQQRALQEAKPGSTLDAIHDCAVLNLTEGLIELGLLAGPVSDAIEQKSYMSFYMHKTSHYLGMDVHDVGRYYDDRQPRPLQPGVVITIEPGLYVAADADVPERFRGIGIRIEDDVLITEDGCENLTAGLAKTIEDVEAACRN